MAELKKNMDRRELQVRVVHAMVGKGFTFDQEQITKRLAEQEQQRLAESAERVLVRAREAWSSNGV